MLPTLLAYADARVTTGCARSLSRTLRLSATPTRPACKARGEGQVAPATPGESVAPNVLQSSYLCLALDIGERSAELRAGSAHTRSACA